MLINNLFYVFSVLAIFAASMVVITKNPVRAVLFLVLTFFLTAVLWMLIEAEFLAIALILIYVGAVLVLFMFVIMMLDVDVAILNAKFMKYLPFGVVIAVLFLTGLIFVLGVNLDNHQQNIISTSSENYSNVKYLGTILYIKYLLEVEIAGVLLLAAMVAAISLTFRGPKNRKAQRPDLQVRARKQDRLRIIEMKSERPIVPTADDGNKS